MEDIFKALQQPEYVHVVLNHLPIIGLLAGLLILAIALLQRSRATALAAYIVILLMSLSIVPVTEYGERAEDQVESLLDEPGRQWLHIHEERADRAAWFFYATAAFAAAGLVVPRVLPKSAVFLSIFTLLIGGTALFGGVWVASAGGKIMHREFRYSAPPAEK